MDFEIELENVRKRIDERKAANENDELLIQNLQQQRNALTLAEKLKDFPPELVNSHKACSFCGAEMRPFRTQTDKYWGCQTGQGGEHDVVTVE